MDVFEYMDIPFVNGGRSRESGLDCWGLVCLVYREKLGLDLPPHPEADADNGEQVRSLIAQDEAESWREVDRADRREGDVVVLRVKGLPWHVGVLVDPLRFVHTSRVKGVCVERLESVHWASRIVGYRRLRMLDERPGDHPQE